MLEELRNLQAALVMFTRLPLASQQLQERHFQQASCYLPFVGLLLAGLGFAIYSSLSYFVSAPYASLITLISIIIITGAIHEDGFADCCDGFGAVPGGSNSHESIEKILSIMKDSRLGTYAVLGLLAMFIARWQLFDEIPAERHLIAFLSLYTLSKFAPLFIIWQLHYVKSQQLNSKMTDSVQLNTDKTGFIAAVTLALLFFFMPATLLLLQCAALLLSCMLLKHYFNNRLGGYNGDCLGASEQVSGLFMLLVVAFYF